MYAIGGPPADGSPEDVEDEVTNEDNKTDETESGNNQDESSKGNGTPGFDTYCNAICDIHNSIF